MKHDRIRLYLYLALIAIVSAIVLLLIMDVNVPVDPGRKRLTQEPIRATATPTAQLTVPSFTPTHFPHPTRVEDATPVPTPIIIIPMPPYGP